jgi:ribosomal protein L11 methyltransferase
MSNPDLRFPFLHLDVEPGLAETLTQLLFELGAQGVEERDQGTLIKSTNDAQTEGYVTLVASFATIEEAQQAADNFDDAFSPRIEEIIGDAWRDAWKEHYKPFRLTQRITIRPPWESYEAGPDEMVLELEPGRAFGTGLHETTSLVAAMIDELSDRYQEQPVLDVGTGSGILALIALRLGASQAIAIDNDPDAVAVTNENAQRNHAQSKVQASTQTLEEIEQQFPLVMANIQANVLIPMAEQLKAKVLPGGLLILSGILLPQAEEVRLAYASMELLQKQHKGEWVCLCLQHSSAELCEYRVFRYRRCARGPLSLRANKLITSCGFTESNPAIFLRFLMESSRYKREPRCIRLPAIA